MLIKNGWNSEHFLVGGLQTVRKLCLLHGKGKKKANTLLKQTHTQSEDPFDVKNEIGFVAKQQISVKQKFNFCRIVFHVS